MEDFESHEGVHLPNRLERGIKLGSFRDCFGIYDVYLSYLHYLTNIEVLEITLSHYRAMLAFSRPSFSTRLMLAVRTLDSDKPRNVLHCYALIY